MTLLNPVSKYPLDFSHIFSDVFSCHHIKSDGADYPTRFKIHFNGVIILHIHYKFLFFCWEFGGKKKQKNNHVLQLNSHKPHLGVWSSAFLALKSSLKLQPNQPSHLFCPSLFFSTLNCNLESCCHRELLTKREIQALRC